MSVVQELKKELDIEGNDENTKKKIREKIKDLHPDHNGGDFKTEEDKELYTKLKQGLDELRKKEMPLMTQNEVTSLVHNLYQKNNLTNTTNTLNDSIKESYDNYRSRHNFPKISLASISSFMSLIWFFPNQIENHEVLKSFINVKSTGFTIIWLYTLLGSFLIYWRLYKKEQGYKLLLSSFNTETFKNRIFAEFLNRFKENEQFTKEDFIKFLLYDKSVVRGVSRNYGFLKQRNMDIEVAQNVADVTFLRAEDKEIIKKQKNRSLMDIYQLNEN